MKRAISQEFMTALQTGELRPLLELVKKDGSLDLEMRGCEISIYYQGLKLLSIKEKGGGVYEYIEMNNEYRRRKDGSEVKLPVLSLNSIEDYIIKGKNVIDTYDVRAHFEYEIKQMIIKENNTSPTAGDTDFYVIDTEYQNEENDQFDIIALHIDSIGEVRKKGYASIAIIEIKQGNNTLRTTSKNPGIRRHLEDFKKHITDYSRKKNFIADMKDVVQQKYELGLFSGLKPSTIKRLSISEDIEFYVILANYKKASSLLHEELNSFTDDCKFFTSCLMGYGLYNDMIKSKEDILRDYPLAKKQ